jgi:serine protease Do
MAVPDRDPREPTQAGPPPLELEQLGSLELPDVAPPPPVELPPLVAVTRAETPPIPAKVEAAPLEALEPAPIVPPPAAPADPNRRSRLLPGATLLVLVLLFLYVTPYLLHHWRTLEIQGEVQAIYEKRRAELRAEADHADERLAELDKRAHLASLGFREVARKVAPYVVNVANYREPRRLELAAGKKALFQDPDNDLTYVSESVGSGLIVKPGVILTNYHVVRKAARLRVTFASGQSIGIDDDTVAVDAITDLAIVRLPEKLPEGLRKEADVSCVFADSAKDVQVGDWALAVGSPLGLRQTLTQGVISAKGRLLNLLDMVELLQTDAAINPGNSGGPLFDQLGRVIGINVAIASDNGGNQGIGFAIPSNTARRISEQLLADGEVQRGYLGIGLEELPAARARALKLDEGAVLVKEVVAGEAGDLAGLQGGDIILGVGRETLHRQQASRHLRQIIVDTEPGTQVTLHILRGNGRRELPVTIGRRPGHIP